MTPELVLYSRKNCCLCDEMKEVIRRVAVRIPVALTEIDIDGAPDLQDRFGAEVPVLFINGRKVAKYRVTPRQLRKCLTGKGSFAKTLVRAFLSR